ncbi:NlpC/P60 family protein [Salibacterium halotolerans]|uniref:Cell wall-associated hydrolase, NlpC family n=1 Tax=Salibacterium halotolerans TaxID=1884432 RepID=A0A1I5R2G3_9BACI|nr:NlpC/P60 family protein [Salibacterium halotolerans]SFP52550.1 Cell wall-associated hydrolase, NlpC family [Salibacterium halotolerans]
MQNFFKSLIFPLIAVVTTSMLFYANVSAKEKFNEGEEAYIDVSAASLWTTPGDLRDVDEPAISNPADLWTWTESMSLDEKLWLVGELQTQALYGSKVTIIEENEDWVKVAADGQPTPKNESGYPAWMPKEQLADNQRFNNTDKEPFALVTEPTTQLHTNKKLRSDFKELSYNTRLPVINEKKEAVLVATPSDGNKWIPASDVSIYESEEDIPAPEGSDLVETGKQFLGLPYLWAGTSGFGFDCSGFTHTIYDSYGITIPRDSSVQATQGEAVDRDNLQKGDLLFFAYEEGEGNVHHVGMYAGGGSMIHSPNSSSTVEIIEDWEASNYEIEFAGARRYID